MSALPIGPKYELEHLITLDGPPKAQVVTTPTSPLAWVGLFLVLFLIAMTVIGSLAR
jgi:hypothetical protein